MNNLSKSFAYPTTIIVVGFLAGIWFSNYLNKDHVHVSDVKYDEPENLTNQSSIEALELKVMQLGEFVDSLALRKSVDSSATISPSPVLLARTQMNNDVLNKSTENHWIQSEQISDYERDVVDNENEATSEVMAQDYFQQAEMRYYQEERDENWSITQQELIYELVQDTNKFRGIDVHNLDCRSYTCRLEVSFDPEVAEKHMEAVLVGELGREFPNATWNQEDHYLTLLISQAE